MSKFLVTGGLGLIGHNVVQRLQKCGEDVVIVDNRTTYGIIPQDELDYLMAERWKKIDPTDVYYTDIADGAKFDQIVKNHKPEVIIHMASFHKTN